MSISDERTYDIVVFGATGYTGTYVVEKLGKDCSELKLAIAGRNEQKLKSVLEEFCPSAKMDILIADIDDEISLNDMCKKTKLLINCVGPYRFFGDQVVSQCAKNSTHYVDVSGEPQFLEETQLKYFEEAKSKGLYIVGACGFDSVPCDFGVALLKDKFPGDINSVDTYLHISGKNAMVGNYATWESAIHGLANASDLLPLRKKLKTTVFKKPVPKTNFPNTKRYLFRHNNFWCIPFLGSDKSVASRTEFYNYEFKNERPVQINTYFCISSLFKTLGTLFLGLIFMLMVKSTYGKHLLSSFPEFFSAGLFTKTLPTREKSSSDSFSITFEANGWSEKKIDPLEKHTEKPNKTVKAVFSFPDPAYITTAICVVSCALIILKEQDKLPQKGGVFTPGAAFRNTSLLKHLEHHGIVFNMQS